MINRLGDWIAWDDSRALRDSCGTDPRGGGRNVHIFDTDAHFGDSSRNLRYGQSCVYGKQEKYDIIASLNRYMSRDKA